MLRTSLVFRIAFSEKPVPLAMHLLLFLVEFWGLGKSSVRSYSFLVALRRAIDLHDGRPFGVACQDARLKACDCPCEISGRTHAPPGRWGCHNPRGEPPLRPFGIFSPIEDPVASFPGVRRPRPLALKGRGEVAEMAEE